MMARKNSSRLSLGISRVGVDGVEGSRPPRARSELSHHKDRDGENRESGSGQQPTHAVIPRSAATLYLLVHDTTQRPLNLGAARAPFVRGHVRLDQPDGWLYRSSPPEITQGARRWRSISFSRLA